MKSKVNRTLAAKKNIFRSLFIVASCLMATSVWANTAIFEGDDLNVSEGAKEVSSITLSVPSSNGMTWSSNMLYAGGSGKQFILTANSGSISKVLISTNGTNNRYQASNITGCTACTRDGKIYTCEFGTPQAEITFKNNGGGVGITKLEVTYSSDGGSTSGGGDDPTPGGGDDPADMNVYVVNLEDFAVSDNTYETSLLSSAVKAKNYDYIGIELPSTDAEGTIAFYGSGNNSDRFLYICENHGTSKSESRRIVMAKNYDETTLAFTAEDIFTNENKYYLVFTTTDDFKFIGVKYILGGEVVPGKSHDASLSALEYYEDGSFVSVPGFSPTKYNYEVELPAEYEGGAPSIQATVNDEGKAMVEITQATSLPGTAKAVVTAEDGTTTQTYTVAFSKAGDEPTPGGDDLEQVAVSAATVWDWTKAASVEEIKWTGDQKDADPVLLANVDGMNNNADFNSQALLFSGEYPVRSGKFCQGPWISFKTTVAGFVQVEFSNTGTKTEARYVAVNGVVNTSVGTLNTDVVTSANIAVDPGDVIIEGSFESYDPAKAQYLRIYKITFSTGEPPAEQSHDATLKSLVYDGETSVPGFSPNTFSYSVVLPSDYIGVPSIIAEANDENAKVDITQVTSLPGTAKAVVTAEDGTTKNTYTVDFSKEGTDPTPQPTGEVCAHWRFSGGDAPGVGTHEDGTNMRVEFLTNDDSKSFSNESAAYNASMTDEDMKSQGSKGVKMGASALYLKVSFFDGVGFKAGDVVTICGYYPWKISSTAEGTGDVAASITTGTSKSDYNIGSYTLTSNHEALFFSRAEGTSTGICAIKVTRGGDTPPEPEKSHDATLKSLTYGNDETSVPDFNADKLNYEVVLPSDYEGDVPEIQAEVNDEGKATLVITQAASLPGTAKAVVTAEDGTTKKTYTVEFSKEGEEPQETNVTGVTLNRATLTMNVGATSTLIAQIIPSDATNQNVTWSSSNPSVATVEAGVVTAKTVGSTTITVITEDGGFDATCNVTVKEDTPTPPVPQTDLTIHYPGVYEDVEAKGGYGKEIKNGYEVFYAGRWDNGGTKLTIHVTPEDKSKGITKNETNSSYEAIDGWFKGSGTDKGTGFDPKEEFAEATSRCHTMTSSNSLEMHISGYDQFSLYAADKKWEPNKPDNCKYFKVSIDDVPQTMEPSTSPTIRRFDLPTSGEHVIKISLVGDGNLFGGFSLHEAQVPSVKYLKGNDSTQVVLQTEKLPRDIIYFTKYNKLGETRVIWENGEATGFGLSIKGSTEIGDTLVLSGVANCPVGVYPFHVSSFDENGNETKRLPSGKITVTSDIRATSLTEVEVYEDETMEEIGFSYHALSANDISIDWKGNTPAGIQGYGADGKYYIGGTPTQQGEYPFTISVKGGNSIDGIIKVLPPVSGDNMVLYLYTNGNRETILKKDGIADYISKTMGYTIIPRTANNSGLRSDEDYKKYKWILISEDANADNTEVLALTQQSAILPVLNMKGFAYAEERLSWGDPNNGSLTDNGRYITVQRDDHPIFKGKKLGDKIEVLSKIDEKGLMPIDIHLPGTYCLATSLPRSQTDYHGEDEKHPFTFLHEVPARMRGGKKYICMPIAMSSSKNLTPAGKDLVKAVVNYLLSDDEASIQIPQLQITSFVIDGINGNIDESKNKITFEIDLKEHFGVDKHAIAPTITAASDYTHVFTKLEKDGVVDFSESWSFPVQYEVSDYINRRVYDVAIRFFSSEGIEDVYAVGDWVNIYDIFGRKVSTTNEDIYRMVLPRGVYIIVTETGETFKIMR